MSQTLTYIIGADKRALVSDIQDFHIDFTSDNSNWVQARQYEDSMRQVFVDVKNQDGTPYNLTGANIWFEGILPDKTHKILDANHAVILDATNGQFRFDMPKQAFAVAGSYQQAFFRIVRDGASVTTLEFDLEVLADKVISNLVARDYVTPFEDLYDQLEDIINKAGSDISTQLASWTTEFQNKYNELVQLGTNVTNQLASVQSRLNDLEAQIKANGLFTEASAEAWETEISSKINEYLSNAEPVYSSISDLKKANLTKGTIVGIIGENSANDGTTETLMVTDEQTDIKLDSGLYAKRIKSGQESYYDDGIINVSLDYVNQTHTYFASVAKTDASGNQILPYVAKVSSGNATSPAGYANNAHTSLTVNAGLTVPQSKSTSKYAYTTNGDFNWVQGIIIADGKAIVDIDSTFAASLPDFMEYVAIKSDGSVVSYQANKTTSSSMISDGVQQAFLTYFRMLNSGQKTDISEFVNNEGVTESANVGHALIAFGELSNGHYGFAACDGRRIDDVGMTDAEWQDYLQSLGFVNAWCLDGGGSASFNVNGLKLNKDIDTSSAGYTVDRPIAYTFNIKKPSADSTYVSSAVEKANTAIKRLEYQQSRLDFNYDNLRIKFVGDKAISNAQDLDVFLDNLISNNLKAPVFSNGGHLVGRIHASTQLAPQTTNYTKNKTSAFDFNLSFTGYDSASRQPVRAFVELQSLGEIHERYFKSRLLDGTWSAWHTDGVISTNSSYSVGTSAVTNVQVLDGNGLVQVTCHVDPSLGTSWVQAVTALPVAKYQTYSPNFVYVNDNGDKLKAFVNGGTLNLRYVSTATTGNDITVIYATNTYQTFNN